MKNLINEKLVRNIIFGTFCFCGFSGNALAVQASSIDDLFAISQSDEKPLTLQQKIEMDLLERQERIFDVGEMVDYYAQFFGKWKETLGYLNDAGINAHKHLATNVEDLRMEDFILRFKIACFDLEKCQDSVKKDLDAISQNSQFEKMAAVYASIIEHQKEIEATLNDVEKLEVEYSESVIIQIEVYYEKIKAMETEAVGYVLEAKKLLGLVPNSKKFSDLVKALEERSQNKNDSFHQLASNMLKLCQ